MKIQQKDELIVDSSISLSEALSGPHELIPPREILDQQEIVDVFYYSFDKKLHKAS